MLELSSMFCAEYVRIDRLQSTNLDNTMGEKWLKQFRGVEQTVLVAIKDLLPQLAKDKFVAQISSINKIQRLVDDKEVNLYSMAGFKVRDLPSELKFSCSKNEYKLATVVLVNPATSDIAKAAVWVVNGQIFSVEFSKTPKFLGTDAYVKSASLHQNPMEEVNQSTTAIDSKLPADYLIYVKDGKTDVNGWKILRTEEVRFVVDIGNEPSLIILAERNDAILAVQEGQYTGEIFLVEFSSGNKVALGCSFEDALRTELVN